MKKNLSILLIIFFSSICTLSIWANKNDVIIYGLKRNYHTKRFIKKLKRKKIPYVFYDVNHSPEMWKQMWEKLKKAYPETDGAYLPIVDVNGKVLMRPKLKAFMKYYKGKMVKKKKDPVKKPIKKPDVKKIIKDIKKDDPKPIKKIDFGFKRSRADIIKDYQQNYLGSSISALGWTGSKNSCSAGSLKLNVYQNVVQRINFFRRLVGVGPVLNDSSLNKSAQKKALIMLANGKLNHMPPKNWTCWQKISFGAECLAAGSLGSYITIYIQDYGTHNHPAGHRNIILAPYITQIGYGAASENKWRLWDAIHFGYKDHGQIKTPDVITYPPAGYVTSDLVFYRWTFRVPNKKGRKVNYKKAKVKITTTGGKKLKIYQYKNGIGYGALNWDVELTDRSSYNDYKRWKKLKDKNLEKPLKVEIKNVMINDKPQNFSYKVVMIAPPTLDKFSSSRKSKSNEKREFYRRKRGKYKIYPLHKNWFKRE